MDYQEQIDVLEKAIEIMNSRRRIYRKRGEAGSQNLGNSIGTDVRTSECVRALEREVREIQGDRKQDERGE